MIIKILAITFCILLVIEVIAVAAIFLTRKMADKNAMIIFGNAPLSIKEDILFYDVINIRKHKEFWEADVSDIVLFAAGSEIETTAFKPDDLRDGVRFMLNGITNSTMDVLRLAAAVKYKMWEISFDGGITRTKIRQIQSLKDKRYGQQTARKFGWDQDNVNKKVAKEFTKDFNKTEVLKGSTPKHGMLSKINNAKSTYNKLRYQVLVPKNNPIWEFIEDDYSNVSFYHIYEGHAYLLKSEFKGNYGNLYEFDLLGLEPGKIYVGISLSFDGGKTTFPASCIYGITKNHSGVTPAMEDAELAKPKNNEAKKFRMWNEEEGIRHAGEEMVRKIYDVLVKKHYEDEYTDDFLSLSRTEEFYADYKWLKGHHNSKEEEIHVQRHADRVMKEHSNASIAEKKLDQEFE